MTADRREKLLDNQFAAGRTIKQTPKKESNKVVAEAMVSNSELKKLQR